MTYPCTTKDIPVEEGARLITDLLRLAKRLDRKSYDDAMLIRDTVGLLIPHMPYGTQNRLVEIMFADMKEGKQ